MHADDYQLVPFSSFSAFALPTQEVLLQGGAKQVGKQANKQASRPTFSLPSLGGKAQQVGKTGKIKAAAASNQAKKAASSGAGFFGTGSTRGKSTPPAKSSGSGLLGTGLTRGKSTPPAKGGESGLFGTGSTRGNSPAPAKGGGLLGTRSTRPSTQSTKPGAMAFYLLLMPDQIASVSHEQDHAKLNRCDLVLSLCLVHL